MSSKGYKREESGKGGNEQKQRSQFLHTTITEQELATLKNVLYGYLGFLRNIKESKAAETQSILQAVSDRLPERTEVSNVTYFSYEERMAILEAVIGFKLLLVTTFPATPNREAALAEVERLYQCLIPTCALSGHSQMGEIGHRAQMLCISFNL
jgi:hypothetical protein